MAPDDPDPRWKTQRHQDAMEEEMNRLQDELQEGRKGGAGFETLIHLESSGYLGIKQTIYPLVN